MSETMSVASSVKRYSTDSTNKPVRDLEFSLDLLVDRVGDVWRPVAGGDTVVVDLSEVIPDLPDQKLAVIVVQTSGPANVALFGGAAIPINGQLQIVDRLGSDLAAVDKTISVENPGTDQITITVMIGNLASAP